MNTSETMQNPESTMKAAARMLNPLKWATFASKMIIQTAAKKAIVNGNPIP